MEKLLGKKVRTVFMILLMLLLPINQVVAQRSSALENVQERTREIPEDFREQGEIIAEQISERFDSGILGQTGVIGEDIILEVSEYQPKILRTSLLEDQGAYVYALLTGIPSNPTISIPRISNVVIRRQKVTTKPLGAPVSVGRVRHIRPPRGELSFDNMGYMVIPINKIPRENEVPEEILIDVDARVFFDVSEGLTFGPTKDVLREQNHNEWLTTSQDHSFYAGFVRVAEINGDQVTLVLYDNNLNEVRGSPFTLKVGQASRSLSARAEFGYSRTGRLFDRFNVKVDRVTSLSDKVRLLITRDGVVQSTVLSEGEFLYPGSSWFVENIITDVRGEDFRVKLRNRNAGAGAFFGFGSSSTDNTKELRAKKLNINVTLPKSTKKPVAKGAKVDESLKWYKDLKEEYDKIKESSLGFKDYNDTVGQLEELWFDKSGVYDTSFSTKSKINDLLLTIQRYYAQINVQEQSALNRGEEPTIKLDELTKRVSEVTNVLKSIGEISAKLPSSAQIPSENTALFAYQQARDKYQELIVSHSSSSVPEVRQRVAYAHWRLANLPGKLLSKDTRIQHLNTLLTDFEDNEYGSAAIGGIFDKKAITTLLNLLNRLQSDYQSAFETFVDPVTDETFTVLLAGAEEAPTHLKSKAHITLDGAVTSTYIEGQELLWPGAEPAEIRWIVKEINDKSILLVRSDSGKKETVKLDDAISIDVKAGKGNRRLVKLEDTEVLKEAHISISPVVEQAFSEAIFSLHLPIEKRALDLPLFSDTVEVEITKTEDLLEKLDEILINVREITEYWQKFCFITFGVLWAKNFFSGILGTGTSSASRQKVGEVFKAKHDACKSLPRSDPDSCAGLSYDQFVFQNQNEYENTLKKSSTIIDKMRKLDEKYYEDPKNFKELGKEYNSLKDELFYAEEMGQYDESLKERSYELRTQLKKADIEREFEGVYFNPDGKVKSFDDLGSPGISAAEVVDQTLRAHPNPNGALGELKETMSPEEVKALEDVLKLPSPQPQQYVWNKYGARLMPHYREDVVKKGLGAYIDDLNIGKSANPLKEAYRIGKADTALLGDFKHAPALSFATDGKGKDNVEFVSVDALHYVQVSYRTGGRVDKYELFRRSSPNSPMGHSSDVYLGIVDEQLITTYNKADKEKQGLSKNLDVVRSCISKINRQNSKTKYGRGNNVATKAIGCGNLGNYQVTPSIAGAGASCTDFMSPGDCKILFNACDPVVCPPSRCNLGGNWYVDNVVETGLIGSVALCLPNFGIGDGGVIMPVCLTGIHAGLQNLRSIIDGYRQCLITASGQGRSVGICDQIRSFGICEMLWQEGVAIKDALQQGLLTNLGFGGSESRGGGEYSSFQDTVDNSVESVQFFTQSYAKNTFARYSGGSLPEIGTEVCKAAIFRKAPGVGNFFDEIVRPESPPQFNAFFDEAPYSDIGPSPLSQYKIFYHVFAGDTGDISPVIYSVWLQSKDPYTNEFIFPPTFVRNSRGRPVRGQQLKSGGFASESVDMILPAGMHEICVEIVTDLYGRRVECGFGKVSTGFALNYITDKFTQNELNKRINSADECVSRSSAITEAITERGLVSGVGVGGIGSVASGFTSTGIVRKCSKESPGIGGNENKWSEVGSCGVDERGRDLGICWLFVPAAQNLIKDVSARTSFVDSLNETALRVIQEANAAGKPIHGVTVLGKTEVQKLFDEAEKTVNSVQLAKDIPKLKSARDAYNKIKNAFGVVEETVAKAQFLLAQSFEKEAKLLLVKKKPAALVPSSGSPASPTGTSLGVVTPGLVPVPGAVSAPSSGVTLTAVSPLNVPRSGSVKITLKGTNFGSKSYVDLDGIILGPSKIDRKSSSEIEITLDTSKFTPGKYDVKVINAQDDISNTQPIFVGGDPNTQLKLEAIDPVILQADTAYPEVQFKGTNFVDGLEIVIEDEKGVIERIIPASFIDQGLLEAEIDTSHLDEGSYWVLVRHSTVNIGSNKKELTIGIPIPVHGVCTVSDAYWVNSKGDKSSLLTASNREDVFMVIHSTNCIGQTFEIKTFYEGLIGGGFDAESDKSLIVRSNTERVLADSTGDSFLRFGDREFYFRILKSGSPYPTLLKESDNKLKIVEAKSTCKVSKTETYWGDSNGNHLNPLLVKDGEPVTIVVTTKDCNGKTLEIQILDNENFPDPLGVPITLVVNGDPNDPAGIKSVVPWRAKWTSDPNFIFDSGTPEYIFRIFERGFKEPIFEGDMELEVSSEKSPIGIGVDPSALYVHSLEPNSLLEGVKTNKVQLTGRNFPKNFRVKLTNADGSFAGYAQQMNPVGDSLIEGNIDTTILKKGAYQVSVIDVFDNTVESNTKTLVVQPKLPGACTIVDAFWADKHNNRPSQLTVTSSDDVSMVIHSANCIGEIFKIRTLYEGFVGDSSVGIDRNIFIRSDTETIPIDLTDRSFLDLGIRKFYFDIGTIFGVGITSEKYFASVQQSRNRLTIDNSQVTAAANRAERAASASRQNIKESLSQAVLSWAASPVISNLGVLNPASLLFLTDASGNFVRDSNSNAYLYAPISGQPIFLGLDQLDASLNGALATFVVFEYDNFALRPNPSTDGLALEIPIGTTTVRMLNSPPSGVNAQTFGPVVINNNQVSVAYPQLNNKVGKHVSFAVWIDVNNDGRSDWQEFVDDTKSTEVKVIPSQNTPGSFTSFGSYIPSSSESPQKFVLDLLTNNDFSNMQVVESSVGSSGSKYTVYSNGKEYFVWFVYDENNPSFLSEVSIKGYNSLSPLSKQETSAYEIYVYGLAPSLTGASSFDFNLAVAVVDGESPLSTPLSHNVLPGLFSKLAFDEESLGVKLSSYKNAYITEPKSSVLGKEITNLITGITNKPVNTVPSAGTSAPVNNQNCKIAAFWGDLFGTRLSALSAKDKQHVTVNVRATGCVGDKIMVRIVEDSNGLNEYEAVWEFDVTSDPFTIKETWIAKWVDDGLWFFPGDPEYVMLIGRNGEILKYPELNVVGDLSVTR